MRILNFFHRSPFAAIFAISCLLLIVFTFTLYMQARETKDANNWTVHTYEVIRFARQAMVYSSDIESAQRGYILTHSKSFLETYSASVKALATPFAELRKLTQDSASQQERLQRIEIKVLAWKKELQQQLKQFDQVSGKLLSVEDLERARLLKSDVKAALEEFVDVERALLMERREKSNELQRRYFITLIVGTLLAIGGLLLANVVIMKIAASAKRIEAELENTRKTYQLLLDNLNDGIYDFYPLTGAVSYSESYCRMLGYKAGELKMDVSSFNNLLHPDDAQSTWETVNAYSQRKIPHYAVTFRLRHKDGSWRWILSRGMGIWDKQGALTRLMGVHTDITDQKNREIQLKELNDDLEGFIYIVSHDLRSPLVNLKGFANEIDRTFKEILPVLKEKMPGLTPEDAKMINTAIEEDIPESMGFILSGVERMDMLTTAILELSRTGKREYRQETVSTQAVIKRCLDSLSYEINKKEINVVYNDLPEVVTDPVILEQVIGNILDNAIKYLDPNRKGIITIEAKKLPWEIVFSIKDNGRGISLNDRQKVFDIFRRASNASGTRGAGMGMAHVKTAMRKLGGRVWFDSVLGEGTTFYFAVPQHT